MSSSTSTAAHTPTCAARSGWRSSPARRICSRSRERLHGSRRSRATGSSSISWLRRRAEREVGVRFVDRRQAGRFLAQRLARYADNPAVIVLALPRGGVPVAFEVARGLNAPLDVFIVRKLGLPGHEEF